MSRLNRPRRAPWSLYIWLWLFTSYAAAKNCTFDLKDVNNRFTDPYFSSQAEFDARFQGCTELHYYSINIAPNYTGSLVMSDIVRITGGLYTSKGENDTYLDTPRLTSLEAPALNSIPAIEIYSASSLTFISFPALTDISSVVLGSLPGTSIDFTSMTTLAGSLTISGNISSMNFPNLTTVYTGINIMSGILDPRYSDLDLFSTDSNFSLPGQPIDIDLPKLYNSSLLIAGNISSLNVPELTTTAGASYYYSNGTIGFGNCGNPLNLTFPKVLNTSYVGLVGAIGSVSLPSLLDTGTISVAAYAPLSLILAPLQQVSQVFVSGNITGISMPTVTNIEYGKITSKLPLDCTEVYKIWDQANPTRRAFSCAGLPKKKSLRGAKIGMGLGIPIAIALCVWVVYLRVKWRGRKVAAAAAAAAAVKSVQPVGDVLPAYQLREVKPPGYAEGEAGSVNSHSRLGEGGNTERS